MLNVSPSKLESFHGLTLNQSTNKIFGVLIWQQYDTWRGNSSWHTVLREYRPCLDTITQIKHCNHYTGDDALEMPLSSLYIYKYVLDHRCHYDVEYFDNCEVKEEMNEETWIKKDDRRTEEKRGRVWTVHFINLGPVRCTSVSNNHTHWWSNPAGVPKKLNLLYLGCPRGMRPKCARPDSRSRHQEAEEGDWRSGCICSLPFLLRSTYSCFLRNPILPRLLREVWIRLQFPQ